MGLLAPSGTKGNFSQVTFPFFSCWTASELGAKTVNGPRPLREISVIWKVEHALALLGPQGAAEPTDSTHHQAQVKVPQLLLQEFLRVSH